MSPARRPLVELGAQPVGDQARLGAPPRLVAAAGEADPRRELVPALRAGDEQLDGRRAGRRLEREQPQRAAGVDRRLLAPGAQRREALAELGRERRVEHVEQLLARAEVDRQAANLARVERRGAAAEDVHVRVAEAVDRLELVADREQVVALERLEDPELDRVRVLELVDHDQREPLRPARAGRRIVEQVAGAQLEVVEVDRRPLGLRGVVGGAEAVQQAVDEGERGAGVMIGAGGPVGGPGVAVRLARCGGQRLGAALELGGASAPGHGTAPPPSSSPHASSAARAAVTRTPAPAVTRSRSAASRAAARAAGSGDGRWRRDHEPRAGVAAGAQARVGAEDRARAARGRRRRRGRSRRRAPPAPRPPARARTRPPRAARRRAARAPRSAGPGPRRAAGSAGAGRRSRGSCRSRRRRRRGRARPRPARSAAAAAARRARRRPSR